jgi:hypothetical protein
VTHVIDRTEEKHQTGTVRLTEVENATMVSAERSAQEITPNASQDVPVLALASAVACAAAATLLAWSFFPGKRRRASISGQVSLGALAACAAFVVWQKRQEEASAARHLITHIHEVRDTRWLKKHPIAYG